MNIDNEQLQFGPSKNQLIVGGKGGLWCRLNLDFTVQPQYVLDMQHAQSLNRFDLCQTIFVDNSAGGAAVNITIPASGHVIVVKAGAQGYYNVICPNPIGMVFDSAGGSRVTVFLINVAIPGSTWSAI